MKHCFEIIDGDRGPWELFFEIGNWYIENKKLQTRYRFDTRSQAIYFIVLSLDDLYTKVRAGWTGDEQVPEGRLIVWKITKL